MKDEVGVTGGEANGGDCCRFPFNGKENPTKVPDLQTTEALDAHDVSKMATRPSSLLTRALTFRRLRSRYSSRPFYLTLLVLALLAGASVLLSATSKQTPLLEVSQLVKRSDFALGGGSDSLPRPSLEPSDECHLVHKVKDQCSFVRTYCGDHEIGIFSYLQLYYCKLAHAKPIAFAILAVWLAVLFNTIGIAASDFLCVNLSTIASILGMSESLTGVTFLAFGNGSPDVFSTFAAMNSNSGGLAIGELVGAAGFITAVVAGSMALVRPFRVARRSFVRDVVFFVFSASFTMVLLADGKLYAWECVAMILSYVFYVFVVVTWHWYLAKKRRQRERDLTARAYFHIPENQELEEGEEEEDDDPVTGQTRPLLRGPSSEDFNALERADVPLWTVDDVDEDADNRDLAEIRGNMRVTRGPSGSRRPTITPIRPSLVGFPSRSQSPVVGESSASPILLAPPKNGFQSPQRLLEPVGYQSADISPGTNLQIDTSNSRPTTASSSSPATCKFVRCIIFYTAGFQGRSSRTQANKLVALPIPTLSSYYSCGFISNFIRLANKTLVPDTEGLDGDHDRATRASLLPTGSRIRQDSEAPVPPTLPKDQPITSSPKEFNRWLLVLQLLVAPCFIALIAWSSLDSNLKPRNLLLSILVALLASAIFLTILLLATKANSAPNQQLPRRFRPFVAFLGFVVSIAWISTLASEVVNLLKAIGVILSISDSLLGLTIFAVGNSLGDLVADITVARLGYPVMALSACFGGPMLNILLGVGMGGLYMTLQPTKSFPASTTGSVIAQTLSAASNPYEIELTKTLLISAATLLVTLVLLLIIVPLNGWWMDRKIGWGLVALWTVTTVANVVLEVVSSN
ncbi:predicted protein [Histoplasma mississippiense (nom. inval.)]|uniref:predicted protein n=1 Tax=Ajellomyces capsulatus (strain NAm1 / WU24) TaxID=2059318 RepID=UPI000157C964|nr:predicted protein [Histoplasma mississippiense (nom. inval.)]EDN09248.1 predicted protein [Histoplasma mississippiense (nom. inval.)]